MSIVRSVERPMICSGLLFEICMAVNREIKTQRGEGGYCILASAAARDILEAKGWEADVMVVEAVVFPDDRSRHAKILGGDGDGTRRPAAKPGCWHGHLAAIAEDRWLIDPSLDQTGLAPPMVVEFPEWWLAGGRRTIRVPIDGGWVRYRAYPGRGGYRYKPDFRPSHRREIVQPVVNQLGPSASKAAMAKSPSSTSPRHDGVAVSA